MGQIFLADAGALEGVRLTEFAKFPSIEHAIVGTSTKWALSQYFMVDITHNVCSTQTVLPRFVRMIEET